MAKKSMEERLISKQKEEKTESDAEQSLTWSSFRQELKRIGYIAGPMVPVLSSQFLLQVVSIMIVGHLGDLSLSSASLAISLAGVPGFIFLLGMASGLETLCGQAYGAQQYQKFGMQTYTAIFSLILVCLPLSFIWINMEKLLLFIGQDPLISHEAGKFTVWLVPRFFGLAILCNHWFDICKCKLGCSHAHKLLCHSSSPCTSLLGFGFQVWTEQCWWSISNKYFNLGTCDYSWIVHEILFCLCKNWSSCFHGVVPRNWEFFRFVVPSAVMICTRISNELGAGNPFAARVAVMAAMFLAVLETTILSTTLFACRHVYGYTFSNKKEVIDCHSHGSSGLSVCYI